MQFNAYNDPENGNRMLLNVQADVLSQINSRIVIPLVPVTPAINLIAKLNPVLNVNGTAVVLMTQQIAPIPIKALGPHIANLNSQSDVIANALDMLLKGF